MSYWVGGPYVPLVPTFSFMEHMRPIGSLTLKSNIIFTITSGRSEPIDDSVKKWKEGRPKKSSLPCAYLLTLLGWEERKIEYSKGNKRKIVWLTEAIFSFLVSFWRRHCYVVHIFSEPSRYDKEKIATVSMHLLACVRCGEVSIKLHVKLLSAREWRSVQQRKRWEWGIFAHVKNKSGRSISFHMYSKMSIIARCP